MLVLRAPAAIALTVFLCTAAACGGSNRTASVRDVERVFAEHGVPFQAEIRPNPLLRQDSFFGLPARREQELVRHLRAQLIASNGVTFESWEALVFDSASAAEHAQQLDPGLANRDRSKSLSGNTTSRSGFVLRQGNVIVMGDYDSWPTVHAALADLR